MGSRREIVQLAHVWAPPGWLRKESAAVAGVAEPESMNLGKASVVIALRLPIVATMRFVEIL
jgi:hypothetical protein